MYGHVRSALIFTLLTWARSADVRLLKWAEFEGLDGPEPIWRVPPERMKARREHLIPLSRQAAQLIINIRNDSRRYGMNDFVFPGETCLKPISANAMIMACYRMDYYGRQTVHGMRGVASTWANEREQYSPDWIEMALAHFDGSVRGVYNSARYLTPRRRMLQDWADEVSHWVGDGDGLPLVNTGFDPKPVSHDLRSPATSQPLVQAARWPRSSESEISLGGVYWRSTF